MHFSGLRGRDAINSFELSLKVTSLLPSHLQSNFIDAQPVFGQKGFGVGKPELSKVSSGRHAGFTNEQMTKARIREIHPTCEFGESEMLSRITVHEINYHLHSNIGSGQRLVFDERGFSSVTISTSRALNAVRLCRPARGMIHS